MGDTPPFDVLPLDLCIDKIAARLKRADTKAPAFTMLIGSGFSVPVFPTAGQMLSDIPWWLYFRGRHPTRPFPVRPAADRPTQRFERDLWRQIRAESRSVFELIDGVPDRAKPENAARAYQAIMSGQTSRGLSEPQLRRQYLRDVSARAGPKVNGAHIFLASLLQAQEGWHAPFCRTIFTTNFDPLLQRSLQLVNTLYYMTDRPEVLEPPADDETTAVHLIYTHGSVHRYLLLNTEPEIVSHAQANAPHLTSYFERHGVIVLGYSGWRDTTMQALQSCRSFDGNLYWCDVHGASEAASRLRPEVVEFLRQRRGNAFYVEIPGADNAMMRLHRHLKLGEAPKFILAPVRQGVEVLRHIDVSTVSGPRHVRPAADSLTVVLKRTLMRMEAAQQAFDEPDRLAARPVGTRRGAAGSLHTDAVVAQRMNDAMERYDEERIKDAIALWTKVIKDPRTPVDERTLALIYRGLAHDDQSETDVAYADYSAAIAERRAQPDLRAWAFLNRGFLRGDRHESARELEDYSASIRLRGVPADTRARALLNRGLLWTERGAWREAVADFNAAAKLDDVPADLWAEALVNRGYAHGELSNLDAAIEDYKSVIEAEDAPLDQKARALVNRALIYGELGRTDSEVVDYTTVIEMKGAPRDERSEALVSRGKVYGDQGRFDEAIEDYSAVIRMRGALVEQRSRALLNRGIAFGEKQNRRLEIADYTRVIALRDAPPDHHLEALVNRGLGHAEAGRLDRAVEDYGAVIGTKGAPVESRAEALAGRADVWSRLGKGGRSAADWKTLCGLSGAPVALKNQARQALRRISAAAR
jgi:tetratricopeptide (TPR) repeat protein